MLDEYTKKLIYGVVKEDDILKQNIVSIEMVEQRRDMNPDMDAIYILCPQDHIAECVISDIQRRRYRDLILIWISPPGETLERIRSTGARVRSENLPLDFYPRESNLITFQDKKSFLILFHPLMDRRVSEHLGMLARRVCLSSPLGRNFQKKIVANTLPGSRSPPCAYPLMNVHTFATTPLKASMRLPYCAIISRASLMMS